MKRSTERILTTHTGSLPRPPDLLEMIEAKEAGKPYDENAFDERVRTAVAEVVKNQVSAGIDIVSDGELGKPSFATYVKHRLSGFDGVSREAHVRRSSGFPRVERHDEAELAGYRRQTHVHRTSGLPRQTGL